MSLLKFEFTSNTRKSADYDISEHDSRQEQQKVAFEQKQGRVYLGSIWEKSFYYPTKDGKPDVKKTDGKTKTVTWINYDPEDKIMKYYVHILNQSGHQFIVRSFGGAPLKSNVIYQQKMLKKRLDQLGLKYDHREFLAVTYNGPTEIVGKQSEVMYILE